MTQRIGLGWVPLILASALGFSSNPCLPIWLNGATERFHFTAAQSGLIASLELGSVAAASILWGAFSRSSRTIWPVLAIVLSVLGNFLSFKADAAALLIAARVLTGLSYGVVLADITRRAAQMPNAHRVFAVQQLGLVAFVTVFFSSIPKAIETLGAAAPFLYNGGLGLLALASLIWLPAQRSPSDAAAHDSASILSETKSSNAIPLMIGVILLTFMAQGALWTYITPAAKNAGVGLAVLGQVLAVGAMLSMLAPITAERLGFRFGRALPYFIGHGGLIASILFLAFGFSTPLFLLGAIGINLFILFVMSFMLATLADLDSSGRAAAVGPAFLTIGSALGPLLGGIVINASNIETLGIVATAVMVAGLVLALVVNGKIPANAKPAHA